MTEDGSKALLWVDPAVEPHRRKKMHGYIASKPIKEKKSYSVYLLLISILGNKILMGAIQNTCLDSSVNEQE